MCTKTLTLTRLAALVATAVVGLAATSCGSESASDAAPAAFVETAPPAGAPLTTPVTTAAAVQATSTEAAATDAPTTTEHAQAAPAASMPATTVAATTDPATTTSGSTRLATTEVTVAATVTTPIAAPPRPTAPVDELVSVGGARMHVRCAGSGDATVVLIAGFTGDHSDFVDIEPRLTEVARVCSYDRFGTGFSDPAPISQTFATQARDLRDALETLGEPGPFVAVGHSFGGAVAVTFTSLDPGDVGGLLLLDASPATWNATVCSVAQDGSATADMWMRTCAMQDPANNVEALDGPAAFAEVATIRSLGDVPMIVATASDHDYTADDFDPASGARLTQAWFDGQDHWASLSSNSQLISVDSGHYIQSDQPDLVIEQINGLLQLVS